MDVWIHSQGFRGCCFTVFTLRNTAWYKSLSLAPTVWYFSAYQPLISEDVALRGAVCERALSQEWQMWDKSAAAFSLAPWQTPVVYAKAFSYRVLLWSRILLSTCSRRLQPVDGIWHGVKPICFPCSPSVNVQPGCRENKTSCSNPGTRQVPGLLPGTEEVVSISSLSLHMVGNTQDLLISGLQWSKYLNETPWSPSSVHLSAGLWTSPGRLRRGPFNHSFCLGGTFVLQNIITLDFSSIIGSTR